MRCALFLRIVSVFCRVWKAKATGTLFRPGILEAAEHAPASGGLRWNEYQTETGCSSRRAYQRKLLPNESYRRTSWRHRRVSAADWSRFSAEGFSSRIQPPIECIHSLP
jgi:hypothetical protein